ncbi:hypothetical protein ACQHIV_02415 [Kribbella sp. GL6]|uniref:hypothetical protein n=1 Tax=Kribbella sp. GL6 TaxID=3419765 RepID=UPI003D05291D
MPESAQRVPEDSAAYREFARLYDLARSINPTGVDGWNGGGRQLYATDGPGGFDHATGAIGVDESLLRHELTGRRSETPRRQAHALATVLHRATEAGMPKDAPGAANAVRNDQSLALHDGVASVRAADDFTTFAQMAGYSHLAFDPSQQTGTYAAANDLIHQVSGVRVDRTQLLDQLGRGPVAMHFDQLADAVVQNRLHDAMRPDDRRAVRRELIGTMLHPAWEKLAGQSPEAGRHVADQIGRTLNAKVDEIRQRHQSATVGTTADGATRETGPTSGAGQAAGDRQVVGEGQGVAKAHDVAAARFLTGMAPAGGAVVSAPRLGQGARGAAPTSAPGQQRGRTQE